MHVYIKNKVGFVSRAAYLNIVCYMHMWFKGYDIYHSKYKPGFWESGLDRNSAANALPPATETM